MEATTPRDVVIEVNPRAAAAVLLGLPRPAPPPIAAGPGRGAVPMLDDDLPSDPEWAALVRGLRELAERLDAQGGPGAPPDKLRDGLQLRLARANTALIAARARIADLEEEVAALREEAEVRWHADLQARIGALRRGPSGRPAASRRRGIRHVLRLLLDRPTHP